MLQQAQAFVATDYTYTDLQHARGVEKTTKRRQTRLKSTVQRQKTIKTEETIK